MGTFAASLRALGDVRGLPATVEIEDGVISIAAGETSIGEWALNEIQLEPIPTGYRIAAEGDQILLEIKEIDAFNEELNAKRSRFRRKSKGVQKVAAKAETVAPEEVTPPVAQSQVKLEPRPATEVKDARKQETKTPKVKKQVEPKPEKQAADAGFGTKVLAWIDKSLDSANESLGPYLPEWVFTRLMFGIVFLAVILALVMPGLVSALMLISGALVIVFGAVIYTDPMLASRWLPGRTTPTHVLLFGVAILMLGVLLGVIAG